MPPPLPSQQGSRAGLITALVIFIIGFVVSTIFWIQNAQKLVLQDQAVEAIKKKYEPVIADSALSSDTAYATALDDRKEMNLPTAFDVVREQRDELAKVLSGAVVPAKDARRLAEGGVQLAIDALPKGKDGKPVVQITTAQPITSVPGQIATAYASLYAERDQLQQQVQAGQTALQTAATEHQKALADKDALIAAANAENQKTKGEIDAARQQQQGQYTTFTTETATQIAALNKAIADSQTAIAAKDQDLKATRDKLEKISNFLKKYRLDPKENITRKPDGAITRVPGDGYCYINIGEGDHLSVGMTFEVYDRSKGIPPVGDGLSEEDRVLRRPTAAAAPAAGAAPALALPGRPAAEAGFDVELPRGKGSIEIVAIGPGHTSQCKIIKVEQGQVLNEGDIIGNLVYDPKIKPVFFVYGDFDLGGTGRPSAQDTAVIKRLIEQWGGRVIANDPTRPAAESLSIEADFVIMGAEPKVPVLSEEDKQNPVEKDRADKLEAQRKAWLDVRGRASELGAPVMNQNRFLYYTGYYDQRSR